MPAVSDNIPSRLGAHHDALIYVCDCRHEALLLLLRQDIWGALAMAACRPNLAALSHACQVCSLALGEACLFNRLHLLERAGVARLCWNCRRV